jgi:HAE1 family hydrophobic/amphiphilic exporter-1
MTTMMLVASMIPIALGQGPGAAGRASMAKVIIGGQMLCLLLSLLVTPVSYSIFDDWSQGRFLRRKRAKAVAPAPVPVGALVPEPGK